MKSSLNISQRKPIRNTFRLLHILWLRSHSSVVTLIITCYCIMDARSLSINNISSNPYLPSLIYLFMQWRFGQRCFQSRIGIVKSQPYKTNKSVAIRNRAGSLKQFHYIPDPLYIFHEFVKLPKHNQRTETTFRQTLPYNCSFSDCVLPHIERTANCTRCIY